MLGLFALGLACMTTEVRDDVAATDSGHADASGSAGDVPPPSTGICPATGAVLRCGQPCILVFKGVSSTLFVQTCH